MATERSCRFEQDGNLLIITLLPELAEVPWADVEEIGSSLENRVLDRDKPQVIVDLTPLAHMGSGMVALVVRIWKAAQQQGGKFAVVNSHELVGEVLTLAGLSDRWKIVKDRAEARKHLDVRAQATQARPVASGNGAAAAPAASARGGGWLATCAVLAVLASAAALVSMFLFPGLLGPVVLKALLFGGAVIGIVLGTLSLAWYPGVPRFTGVGVLVCGVALLVAGLILVPPGAIADDPAPDPAPAAPVGTVPATPAATDPALVDPALVDPALVDPAAIDPAVVDEDLREVEPVLSGSGE